MKELLRTNDLVRLSWLQALLADAGIETIVLDQNAAAIEGGISALQRRLMVREEDHRRALMALAQAGERPE
jgi:Putative prokaryotic signal transducing protein